MVPGTKEEDAVMEQKFETLPKAGVKLEGHRVTRGPVVNDWGLRLQWEVRRDGQVIANPPARVDLSYEHADKTPGKYEIILQTWKYVDYKKDASGEFVNSKFVEISEKVSYVI
jgi:hypothetical protein